MLVGFFMVSISMSYGQETADSTEVEKEAEASDVPSVDGALLKKRLGGLQNAVPLTYNQYVHGFVDFFVYRKPSFTKNMLERRDYYFPIFEAALKKHGIPDEIKYLSIIESGLNPKAISYAGAAGLWQFMPKTGRIDFGLRIDRWIDERHHIAKSTEAACLYMKQLYRIFNDWELVLAAYNTGPGNVKRAIRKAGGGGFYDIYPHLHKQTRGYVPQYVAMVYMMNYAADHGIVAEVKESIPANSPINVNGFVDLKTFSNLAKIPYDELLKVNPHVIKNELPESTRNFDLAIPDEYFTYVEANKKEILDSASKMPIKYTAIPKEEVVVLTEKEKPVTKPKVKVEQEEEIKNADGPDEYEEVAKRKPKLRYHTVKRGENLNEIAKQYGVDLYDIKKWNGIKQINKVYVGKKLKLYLENAPLKAEYFSKNSRKTKAVQKVGDEEETERGGSKSKKTKTSTHLVKKGETLSSLARKYAVSVSELREWNDIGKNEALKYGQKVKVVAIVKEKEEDKKATKSKSKKSKVVEEDEEDNVKAKYHTVKKGETIWSISQKYEGCTVDQIRKLNKLKGSDVMAGKKLRIR